MAGNTTTTASERDRRLDRLASGREPGDPGGKDVTGNKYELNKNVTIKTYDGKYDGPNGLCK